MDHTLKSLLSAYPLTLKHLEDIETSSCGALLVRNFEKEIDVEAPGAQDYLVPLFEYAEGELSKGYSGVFQELIIQAARNMSLFFKGRSLPPDRSIAHVATASRAGALVYETSSEHIGDYGKAAVEICEGKRPQPRFQISIPTLYDGFLWVACNEELQQEVQAYCPDCNDDTVLNILARPQFRKGWIIKINYPKNIKDIEFKTPTIIDSKGLELWRKCKTEDHWGRTVAMHRDYEDGVAEAVHAIPCILPVGVTLEKVGVCDQRRELDVKSMCGTLWAKTKQS
jgi:hypothetical protein